MMYKSPIEIVVAETTDSLAERAARNLDEQIYIAIQKCGVEVNKEELLRALSYDRNQYDEGYEDGFRDGVEADRWIPASELPEDFMDVLVYFEYFRYGKYNRMYRTIGIGSTYDGKWSSVVNGSTGWRKLKILAWMPLPDAPKDGDT